MKLPHVHIEPAALRHEPQFLAGVRRSRELHRPWGPTPASSEQYRRMVDMSQGDSQRAYLLFSDEVELVGVVTISQIVRGPFCSGYLGYYAFVPHNGRGYLSSGLSQVVHLAFDKLRLHRLEANIQPKNMPSRKLVERLGFRLEGYSEKYLKIGGRWRDHERWALTKERWLMARRRQAGTMNRAQ
jgi:ribosomal-protein-alanine N-acetyltransferase